MFNIRITRSASDPAYPGVADQARGRGENTGCSVVYIYKLTQRGELPSYIFGRSVRFHPHEVSEFIKSHRRKDAE